MEGEGPDYQLLQRVGFTAAEAGWWWWWVVRGCSRQILEESRVRVEGE